MTRYYRFEPATGELVEEFDSDKRYPANHSSITKIEPPEPRTGCIPVFNCEKQQWTMVEASRASAKRLTKEEFDRAADEIHLEVGRAIDEWSRVEQWLHDLFIRTTSIFGAAGPGLSAAFWAAQNFETKLAMVSAAIFNRGLGTNPKDEVSSEWATIRNKLKAENKNKRNKLAHGNVISPVAVIKGPPVAPPVWVPFYDDLNYRLFKLVPRHARGKAKSFEELTAKNIAKWRSDFISAQHLIANFLHKHHPIPERGKQNLPD